MAQEVRLMLPEKATEAPYFSARAPTSPLHPTERKPKSKRDPHEKIHRVINIILRVASVNGYDRYGRIKDREGNPVDNTSILHLLLHALTPGRVLVGEREFINLLYRAHVDPDMIVNDNVRSQLLGMRDSHTSTMAPQSPKPDDDIQHMDDIEPVLQNDEPIAYSDPPQDSQGALISHPQPPPPLQRYPPVPQPPPSPLPDPPPLHHPPPQPSSQRKRKQTQLPPVSADWDYLDVTPRKRPKTILGSAQAAPLPSDDKEVDDWDYEDL